MRKFQKLIFVEDGSIKEEDIKKLEALGFMVIIYRQGSTMPEMRLIEDK